MKLNDELFERLLYSAQNTPRKRSHQNLHASFDDPVQRLCIGLVRGTYVRPHFHAQANKWEMMLALRGSVGVLFFDHAGVVKERHELKPSNSLTALEIVPGILHAVFPLTDKAILLEIKEGPYSPLGHGDFAVWAPKEGTHDVVGFLEWAERARVGERYSEDFKAACN